MESPFPRVRTLVAVPIGAINQDGEMFPNPEEFDGFRFAKLRERDGPDVTRHQAHSPSIGFGYGPYLCMGFAFRYPSRSPPIALDLLAIVRASQLGKAAIAEGHCHVGLVWKPVG